MRGGRWRSVAVVVALVALVAAAGCGSAAPTPAARSDGHGHGDDRSTTTTTTTSTTTSSTQSGATSSTQPSTTTSTAPTTTTAPGPENLLVSATDKQFLTAAFVDYSHLPAQDIAGTAPGSVYFAYVPSTDTYWAVASFVPTPSASVHTQIALQDDGSIGVFSRKPGAAWTMLANAVGIPVCWSQSAVPPAVLALWGLSDGSNCPATTTTTTTATTG